MHSKDTQTCSPNLPLARACNLPGGLSTEHRPLVHGPGESTASTRSLNKDSAVLRGHNASRMPLGQSPDTGAQQALGDHAECGQGRGSKPTAVSQALPHQLRGCQPRALPHRLPHLGPGLQVCLPPEDGPCEASTHVCVREGRSPPPQESQGAGGSPRRPRACLKQPESRPHLRAM